MKAARFYGIGDIRIENIPEPRAPGQGEVLLQVLAAGLCGSDIHNFKHGRWIASLPVTPGHEICGRVMAVGGGFDFPKVGQRVVADSRVTCGTCNPCREGRGNLCAKLGFVGEVIDGGFAERVLLPANGVHIISEVTAPQVAAMCEPLAVALHALRRLGREHNRPLLIVGAGPIGALSAMLLRNKTDGNPALIADLRADRRNLVADATGAKAVDLAEVAPGSMPYAIDATGSTSAFHAILDRVAPGGKIALAGIFHGETGFDLNRLVEREVDLIGVSAFGEELPDAVSTIPTIAGPLAKLATIHDGLDGLPEIYRAHAAGKAIGIKTIFRIGT